MSLYTVTTGSTILAADVNQLVNVLQRASGQTEAGKYFMAVPAYTTGAVIAQYICSLSRVSTPVSVSIDTADLSPVTCNSPTTARLTANGFQVTTNSTGTTTSGGCGGNYTIQY